MAHVRYRDSLAALRRQLGLSVLLNVLGMPQGAEALQRMIEQASALHYSRRIEARADRYALDLLAEARLDPGRLADALQHIAEAGPPEPPGRLPDVLEYLQTHPSVQDRIEDARTRSRALQVREEPITVPGGWPVAPEGPTPADLPDT
jgi:predicted Zn-dependent protease